MGLVEALELAKGLETLDGKSMGLLPGWKQPSGTPTQYFLIAIESPMLQLKTFNIN